jgi:hypothetical protein
MNFSLLALPEPPKQPDRLPPTSTVNNYTPKTPALQVIINTSRIPAKRCPQWSSLGPANREAALPEPISVIWQAIDNAFSLV